MPLVFTNHSGATEREEEFAEIWRVLDGLRLTVEWALRRLATIEEQLGIEPEPPPSGGETPVDWPT